MKVYLHTKKLKNELSRLRLSKCTYVGLCTWALQIDRQTDSYETTATQHSWLTAKMLLLDTFFQSLKCAVMCLRTPLAEFTSLPRSLSWI